MVDLLLRRFGADPSIGKGLVTPFRIAVNQQDKHPELRDLLDVSDRSSYVTMQSFHGTWRETGPGTSLFAETAS